MGIVEKVWVIVCALKTVGVRRHVLEVVLGQRFVQLVPAMIIHGKKFLREIIEITNIMNKTKKIVLMLIVAAIILGSVLYLFEIFKKIAISKNVSQPSQTNKNVSDTINASKPSAEVKNASGQVLKIDGEFIYLKNSDATSQYKIDSLTPVLFMVGKEKIKSGLPGIKTGQQVSVSFSADNKATEIIIEKQ
jgi:translation elongation factor P/translation initiation factor 5A